MLDNFKNSILGVATEKQDGENDKNDLHWSRDGKGNMVDEFGHLIAASPDGEEAGYEHT